MNTDKDARFMLELLQQRGFDKSWITEDRYVRVACSQCEALVISGHACHEQGCPHSRKAHTA